MPSPAKPEPAEPRRRNPELTRASILAAATQEFARHGFDAARTERIVKTAGCNTRMLYHYFGSKQRLYIAVLESVYTAIRAREKDLDLTAAEPREGLLRLTRFTWAHFLAERVFIDITRYENLARGKYIRQSKAIAEMSSPLIAQLRDVLQRGLASGAFRHVVDPLQLYVSMVALCVHHLNNAHTLGATFATDLSDPVWLTERKAHVETMVLRMVGADPLDDGAASA
ncbi:MAG: TetR/AcrR family transcriptional regulator [Pseudomonadota bacterium]|nr:TetR/AcrR family transcriptional regulator [Pseudomonadota bacterium]